MEEIIGFGWFFKNNPDIFERFPRITKAYRDYTTAGMALAVYEEFISFFGISLLAYFFENYVLNVIWFGLLISLTIHFVIHRTKYFYKKIYSFPDHQYYIFIYQHNYSDKELEFHSFLN